MAVMANSGGSTIKLRISVLIYEDERFVWGTGGKKVMITGKTSVRLK